MENVKKGDIEKKIILLELVALAVIIFIHTKILIIESSNIIEFILSKIILLAAITSFIVIGLNIISISANKKIQNLSNGIVIITLLGEIIYLLMQDDFYNRMLNIITTFLTITFFLVLKESSEIKKAELKSINLSEFNNYEDLSRYLNLNYKEKWNEISIILLRVNYLEDYYRRDVIKLINIVEEIIIGEVRRSDKVFKLLNQEFVIILNTSDKSVTNLVADRIKKQIENDSDVNIKYNISVSMCVCDNFDGCKSYAEVLNLAQKNINESVECDKDYIECYSSILSNIQGNSKDDNGKIIASIETLVGIINSRDKVTYNHVKRVVYYAKIMAEHLNLSEEDKVNLVYGAYMHDIGKINVPRDILNKTDNLTEDEWRKLEKHPLDGVEIIKNIDFLHDTIPLILQHHERYDGTGYPYGIKGENISYLARILSVIDSFDAMTSVRPYNKKLSFHEGYKELIRCSGTQFDKKIVEEFIRLMETRK